MIASVIPSRSDATTGNSHSAASNSTRPNPSISPATGIFGITKQSAELYIILSCSSVTEPSNLTFLDILRLSIAFSISCFSGPLPQITRMQLGSFFIISGITLFKNQTIPLRFTSLPTDNNILGFSGRS